ncbi:MAG: response regulator [Deltaproteobacteria bacterium]|nr:response regulator [Deltaproteobacteria bacterium]
MRIIIIEDDQTLATLIKNLLFIKGHEVQVFSDPTVWPIYKDHEPQCPKNSSCADVIISDHLMPNMTGIDFFKLQRLRGCNVLDANKALVTGSDIDDGLKNDIEELGCHYICKPFRVSEIIKWIDECAERLR